MATDEAQNNDAAAAESGAFGKDKQFGNRLDQVVAIGEPFLLLGGKVTGETIETVHGDAEVAKVLIQKLNKDTGSPIGAPIRANTVQSAIVEKIKALTPDELAAGPVVQLQVVKSKARNTNATVLTWMRNLVDGDDFSEFGLDPDAVSRAVDQARDPKERINY